MKILQISFHFLAYLFCSTLWADWGLRDGEELEYAAKWTGVPAGQIVMSTKHQPRLGEKMYEISLDAKTSSFWSMVYKVRDTIKTRVNVEEGRSYFFYKDVRQGRRHLEEKATISYQGEKIIYSKQNFSAKEEANIKEFELDSEKHQVICDPLSIIYKLRSIDFSKPENAKTKHQVFADKGVYDFEYNLKKSDVINSKAFGKRDVWLVEPSAAYKGGIVDAGRLQLWVDKTTGIPLKLTFHIPVGWATLELKESNHPDLKKVKSKGFFSRRR